MRSLSALPDDRHSVNPCPGGFNMFRKLKSFLRNNSGVTALEYGVIAAIIVVAVAGTIGTVGNNLKNTFNTIATSL